MGAFDPTNGGFILPNHGTARTEMLNTINACPGVNPLLPCAPIEKASNIGVGDGLRAFYKKNFQPRLGIAYRPFADNKTVLRAGFGIFTMTSLGQLSFNYHQHQRRGRADHCKPASRLSAVLPRSEIGTLPAHSPALPRFARRLKRSATGVP
ncbi:hypothetical protein [Edaphobacter sp. HDX4]|uniref:hypothetical protein n=1 Tax=Edaphobacter sp. HDX4 TaxID=2794064 RepID=UPI003FA5CE18